MFETAITWLTELIFSLGYVGIMLLMTLESSFIPFPSEVVLPPAGFLAAQGRMNAFGALGAGIMGSLLGAAINYAIAARLGRPLLHRYSKYLLIQEQKLIRAEAFFRRHGEISTFVGRLIPVIRQLISLPAGVARMRIDRFFLYTGLGAGIWCVILTYVGWTVGRHAAVIQSLDELIASPEVRELAARATFWILPALVVIVAVYALWYRRRGRGSRAGPESA